jgi:hypothetical protein
VIENFPETPSFLKEGLLPTVAVDDLKRVFALQQEVQSRHPGQPGSISIEVYQQACTSGSDGQAVWFRLSFLFVLQHLNDAGIIKFPWIHDGKPEEAVFKALATIPMTGINPKVMREGLPFDVEELRRLVQTENI